MIEKCLIYHMSKEECMEALSKHANIMPVITSTVWNELEKENKEFFKAYAESKTKDDRMSEEETSQMIQKMIDKIAAPSSSSSSSSKDSKETMIQTMIDNAGPSASSSKDSKEQTQND
ncbi:hypothetical protein HS088_TW16G00243 [Tripterygium wilfordii]|uniref:Angiotensin-converting enzyme 2 n=2 Tax=Tripterygium wilfordii TaxID=458696 RepID=A0A7J7CIA3_TRIWF|nr:hypothetical protein HS088_TW16G00243 [Tripterygium wilfordii]